MRSISLLYNNDSVKLLTQGTTTNSASKSFTISNLPDKTQLIICNCNLSTWYTYMHWIIDLVNNKIYALVGATGQYSVDTSASYRLSNNTLTLTHQKAGSTATVYYTCFGR